MKKITARVFTFVLALVMCICVSGVNANKALAAEVPTISITPLVTSSVNSQAFQVSTEVEAQYEARYGSEVARGTIPAGTSTVSFSTSEDVKLEVFAPYVNDSGSTKYVTVRSTSSNAYWVDVYCVTENGETLQSDRIKLSKYNEPQVVYNAPAVIDNGASEYRAANPTVVFKYGDTSKSIVYTSVDKGTKTVTINYVDEQDAVLYTETKVLGFGESAVISAPASYTANGNTYTLKTAQSYNVTYDNASSVYTFEYAKQAPAAQLPYNITIKLVDENGSTMHTMTASVDVGKQVTVNLPATYEVGMKQYKLADGQAAYIVRDYASAESKTYTVQYVLAGEISAYAITINFVDRATGDVLGSLNATIEPDGAAYKYDISSKNYIEKNGVTYQVLAGQGNSKGMIVHSYGDNQKVYNLYYAAKQDKNPESYVVTMRYICVNNNIVLATETKIVDVNSSVTFNVAPETMTVAGVEYIRLNGQDSAVVHKYNDAQTSYEIYYRDSSIEMEDDDIIYVPGTNVDTDDNQNTTPDDTQPDAPEADVEIEDNETPADVEPGVEAETEGEAAVVPGEDEVVEEIVDEVIDEEDVPLANAPADATSGGNATPIVIGGIALAVIAVIAIVLVAKKKKVA